MRLVLAFLAVFGLIGGAAADGAGPVVPPATGEPHPVDENWRANHMVYMLHDRNLTMRDGIRDLGPEDHEIKASLAECFDCHAVMDEAGEPVTVADERHFCRVCHDYAAVEVDCFMCHRSTPADNTAYRAMATAEDPASIEAYLARLAEETSE
ncbi:MAG: hypothetical protein KDK53_12035 [Maritimibacter sp.]|nr:hypothetical protein [Maritimibacter sp.]